MYQAHHNVLCIWCLQVHVCYFKWSKRDGNKKAEIILFGWLKGTVFVLFNAHEDNIPHAKSKNQFLLKASCNDINWYIVYIYAFSHTLSGTCDDEIYTLR